MRLFRHLSWLLYLRNDIEERVRNISGKDQGMCMISKEQTKMGSICPLDNRDSIGSFSLYVAKTGCILGSCPRIRLDISALYQLNYA